MKTSDADILFIPGLGGSGPDHWQRRWANRLSTARVVDQPDWNAPRLGEWVDNIAKAIAACARPVVLVGHSIGALTIAHVAPNVERGRVRGAMLVAPPSASALAALSPVVPTIIDFAPATVAPLPFAATLVASRNDPYSAYSVSEELAAVWGARLLDAGDAGHINAESGHGPWPEGLMSFAGFLKNL